MILIGPIKVKREISFKGFLNPNPLNKQYFNYFYKLSFLKSNASITYVLRAWVSYLLVTSQFEVDLTEIPRFHPILELQHSNKTELQSHLF